MRLVLQALVLGALLRPGKVLSCATAVSMALQISSDGLLADVVDWYEDVVGLLRAEVHGAQPQARDFQAGTAEMCVLHTLMLLLSKSCVQQVA